MSDHFGETTSKCYNKFLSVDNKNEDCAENWIRRQCQMEFALLKFKIMFRGARGLIDRRPTKKQKTEGKKMEVSEKILSLYSDKYHRIFLGIESSLGEGEHQYVEEKMPFLEDIPRPVPVTDIPDGVEDHRR